MKMVNSVPDSGGNGSGSQQQEHTRSSGQSTSSKTPPDSQPQLPSFKNMYSSTPPEEDNSTDQLFLPHTYTQESWPSMTQQLCAPCPPQHTQFSPGSPTPPPLAGPCHQSSPHFPTRSHGGVGDLDRHLFTFFPALLPLSDDKPAT